MGKAPVRLRRCRAELSRRLSQRPLRFLRLQAVEAAGREGAAGVGAEPEDTSTQISHERKYGSGSLRQGSGKLRKLRPQW